MLYLTLEPEHAKVIDNEQVVCRELTEEICLPAFKMHELQLLNEHIHCEVERLDSLATSVFTKSTCQIGFACSRRAVNDNSTPIPDVAA